jgi:hypothetical protein
MRSLGTWKRASIRLRAGQVRLGLVRRHFQPKLGQPFFEPFLKGFGFVPILTARHEIAALPTWLS